MCCDNPWSEWLLYSDGKIRMWLYCEWYCLDMLWTLSPNLTLKDHSLPESCYWPCMSEPLWPQCTIFCRLLLAGYQPCTKTEIISCCFLDLEKRFTVQQYSYRSRPSRSISGPKSLTEPSSSIEVYLGSKDASTRYCDGETKPFYLNTTIPHPFYIFKDYRVVVQGVF